MIFLVIPNSIPPAFQILSFPDGNVGQYSDELPPRIAFVTIELLSNQEPKNIYASDGADNLECQAGTVSIVRDGLPIHSYSLSRFKQQTLQVPCELDSVFSVYVRPSFPCEVRVSHDGTTYQVRRVEDASSIPVIDASLLFD